MKNQHSQISCNTLGDSNTVFVGTSGWNYDSWKPRFYGNTPKQQWLQFYAAHFSAIEINATFYRLQNESTFLRWRDSTPAHFRFCIKGNRFLTHNKRLLDPGPAIDKERDQARWLGDKLAAVLWQLPAKFGKNLDRLETFANALHCWDKVQHVIEFRHPSWFDNEVAACLRQHHITLCLSDAADWPLWDTVTANMVYLRLHGHTRTYASAYSGKSLQRWAQRIHSWHRQGKQVHVYFDNDAEGAAPLDALHLLALLNKNEKDTHNSSRSKAQQVIHA